MITTDHKPVLSLHLAQLETNCYFVAHGRKATVLWARYDYRALCHRMHNGNPDHEFLICYRDAQDKARFSKAFKAKLSARIDWAFDTMSGTAKVKTGIGFYPCNADGESCWGALDFDAHADDRAARHRAYAYAGRAFDLFGQNPNLSLMATKT